MIRRSTLSPRVSSSFSLMKKGRLFQRNFLKMPDLKKIEEAAAQHIAGALYTRATPQQQQSAAAMAERDILSQTGPQVDKDDPLFIEAVTEQAIFLLLNVDKFYSPLNDVVSESVEGAGSVTYDRQNSHRIMSSRAAQLCCSLVSKSLELSRG